MAKEYPLCPYAYYKDQKGKISTLNCNKTQKLCNYSRYCGMLFKVVHTSNYVNCPLRKEDK